MARPCVEPVYPVSMTLAPDTVDAATADVVVLGGGPAGAAAARLVARAGHSVVVLTRPASRHSLAESLPPSAFRLLDRIGVREAIDRAGYIRSTGNTVWWGTADVRVEAFGDGALGWQIPRRDFDELMLAEAEQAGASVVRGAVVREVVGRASGEASWVVRYDHSKRTDAISARWVLDCTGRAGFLARREWRQPAPAGRTLALVGIWERRGGWSTLADATHTLVESYDGGWAWSVPDSRIRRYVTVMVDPALTSVRGGGGSAGLTTVYDAELAKATRLHGLVRSPPNAAHRSAAPFARDASSYSASRFADDGVLLVGDAASFVDPLSSFGIKKALSSAWLASVVVHTALTDAAMRSPAIELFERRERAMYDGLQRRFAELSRDAAGDAATDFWRARVGGDLPDPGEPDTVGLRQDAQVLAALDAMRGRQSVSFRPAAALRRVERPTVRDDRVALEEHLAVPAFREGVRYIRSVDLVKIVSLAPAHDQVADLYAAYNRAAGPAPLPDFLGALAVLVGKGMLDLT